MMEQMRQLKSIQEKVVLSKDQYYQLSDDAKRHAFTVSKLHDLRAIERIQQSLTKALKSGQSLETWKQNFQKDLKPITEAHQNLVYRNAMQSAFHAGRYQVQEQFK